MSSTSSTYTVSFACGHTIQHIGKPEENSAVPAATAMSSTDETCTNSHPVNSPQPTDTDGYSGDDEGSRSQRKKRVRKSPRTATTAESPTTLSKPHTNTYFDSDSEPALQAKPKSYRGPHRPMSLHRLPTQEQLRMMRLLASFGAPKPYDYVFAGKGSAPEVCPGCGAACRSGDPGVPIDGKEEGEDVAAAPVLGSVDDAAVGVVAGVETLALVASSL